MKDISFIGIGLINRFQNTIRIHLQKFFNMIFKILEVHGKKLTKYSIRNQIKMIT